MVTWLDILRSSPSGAPYARIRPRRTYIAESAFFDDAAQQDGLAGSLTHDEQPMLVQPAAGEHRRLLPIAGACQFQP
jgi:hypothetical protein